VENFLFAPAFFLNAIGVAIEHLEHGQRLHGFGQFAGHVKRGRECHHSVKTNVIFAAESASIGQRSSSDQTPKVGAGFESGGEGRQELVCWCFLHEADERFERAEVEHVRSIGCESGCKTEVVGCVVADCGDEHSATDVSEKLTARFW
jgi:hypothetical protein